MRGKEVLDTAETVTPRIAQDHPGSPERKAALTLDPEGGKDGQIVLACA